MRLDARDKLPSGMEDYIALYGWHFSKKMCEHAVSKMYKDVNGKKEKIIPYSKEDVDNLMKRCNIILEKDAGYDAVYVANMCKADFLGSSIIDELHLAKFVKDYIDDVDAPKSVAFTRYYSDHIGKGIPIIWDDMI